MTATLLAIAGGHRSLADRTAECGQRITCNGTVFRAHDRAELERLAGASDFPG
jgi:hypothetical protein